MPNFEYQPSEKPKTDQQTYRPGESSADPDTIADAETSSDLDSSSRAEPRERSERSSPSRTRNSRGQTPSRNPRSTSNGRPSSGSPRRTPAKSSSPSLIHRIVNSLKKFLGSSASSRTGRRSKVSAESVAEKKRPTPRVNQSDDSRSKSGRQGEGRSRSRGNSGRGNSQGRKSGSRSKDGTEKQGPSKGRSRSQQGKRSGGSRESGQKRQDGEVKNQNESSVDQRRGNSQERTSSKPSHDTAKPISRVQASPTHQNVDLSVPPKTTPSRDYRNAKKRRPVKNEFKSPPKDSSSPNPS